MEISTEGDSELKNGLDELKKKSGLKKTIVAFVMVAIVVIIALILATQTGFNDSVDQPQYEPYEPTMEPDSPDGTVGLVVGHMWFTHVKSSEICMCISYTPSSDDYHKGRWSYVHETEQWDMCFHDGVLYKGQELTLDELEELLDTHKDIAVKGKKSHNVVILGNLHMGRAVLEVIEIVDIYTDPIHMR